MSYNSPDFVIKDAVKYAVILDDMALKSTSDQDRWIFRRTAKLLRGLVNRVKDLEDGEAESSAAE